MSLPSHTRRVFAIVGASLLAVAALLALIGALLSRTWHVEQSVVINAPSATIHAFVNDLQNWPVWAQWNRLALGADNELSQPSQGAGANLTWRERRGDAAGEVRIVRSDPALGVWFESRVNAREPTQASLEYTPRAGGTIVTWRDSGRLTPIVGGLFLDFYQQRLAAHMATGLERLRERVEADARGHRSSSPESARAPQAAPATTQPSAAPPARTQPSSVR